MDAIRVENITRAFGKGQAPAVDGVSFTVGEGELFGLIGPDGAGKTTLFRILITLLLPDAGHASVGGHDVVRDYQKIRSTVGYMPGKFSLYTDLTVEENLHFFASVFNTKVSDHYALIRDLYEQIKPFKDRRAGKLSGGMKQKLALCCALIHRPTALFLDEPTTGVDPVSRKEFWDMLGRLRAEGITILVSTPYMDEAARCDRIALIQQGRILSVDTPAGLRAGYPHPLYAVGGAPMPALLQQLAHHPQAVSSYAFGEWAHAAFTADPGAAALQGYLRDAGLAAASVQPTDATIEDCFMDLMKRN
ncbi:ABC transporter ATP-binding protein [Dawidia soli]|uniref:ABC transporter ATP-binding protein n=1 Tax=Dawidia soli TaxID=2782352 RepID=A0AAP2DC12_9BACT|nr:ABC transporter ATP-binding protein [Dawidia soli]MBT1689266.1 ABC transporter ATP-binding protein [Dawidia soli]